MGGRPPPHTKTYSLRKEHKSSHTNPKPTSWYQPKTLAHPKRIHKLCPQTVETHVFCVVWGVLCCVEVLRQKKARLKTERLFIFFGFGNFFLGLCFMFLEFGFVFLC